MKDLKILPLIILLSLVFVACEQEAPDSPPQHVAEGIITVAELRQLFNGQTVRFEQGLMVYATVSMDETSGNIYRNIFIEDGTAGINVRMDFATDVREGDRIRISLKGTVLSSYNNMLQLDSVVYGENLIFQDKANPVTPVTATIPEILAGGLQARLVKLEGVQFSGSELGATFANVADGISENRTLIDCSNNRIIVRTSPYADFAHLAVPEGNGSLMAVVSQFGSTWQLLIRDVEELNMAGERCDSGEPGGDGTFENPYNVAHGIAYNSGTAVWVEGYIVGVMEPEGTTNIPTFNGPFTIQTNIIIADSPDETHDSRIMPVQLPPGQIRNVLNLVANPQNKGKLVKLKGNLAAYFVPRPGLREVSGYWMDGQGIGEGGVWDMLTPMTIAQARQLHQGTTVSIPESRMIEGVVITDRSQANITGRNLVINDPDGSAGIVLRFAATHNFALGSLVKVDVSGIQVSRFNGLLQISEVPNNKAELVSVVGEPTPVETTISNLNSNMATFESRLVKLKNVTISGGTTWNGSNGSLTLNDGTGSITHYTTSYSEFRNEALPTGPVSLTVVVSIFNSPQVSIRNLGDIE